mgnify:CR=1 FL=1
MMKKLLCTLLALTLLTVSFVPALAEEPMMKLGGWISNTENPAEIPQEVLDAFNKAIEGLEGCTYEPIALLASQVVAGMNYCLLCRLTVVYPDAQPTYALVYVYQSIEGACELARVENITFSIQEPVAE